MCLRRKRPVCQKHDQTTPLLHPPRVFHPMLRTGLTSLSGIWNFAWTHLQSCCLWLPVFLRKLLSLLRTSEKPLQTRMLCSVSSNTVNLLKLSWSRWFSCCPVSCCSWPPFFFKRGHCLGAGGGVHPGQFASLPQGPTNETNKTTHSHKIRLKQPNYQLHLFYPGRKGRNWRTWKEPKSGKNTSTQTQYLLAVILNWNEI